MSHSTSAVVPTAPPAEQIPHPPPEPVAGGHPSSLRAEKPACAVSVLGMSGKLIVSGRREARISAIAGQQRGRVSRRQLLAAGLSTGQIHRLTRVGWLLREYTGVYVVAYRSEVPFGRETAALLAAPDGAVLSHGNAAAVWGIDAVTVDPDAVHLLVGAGTESRRAGIRTHRSSTLRPADRRVHLQLPVSSPARMLLDLAAEVEERLSERAFDQALVLGVVTHAEVANVLARAGGHRGRRALTELATDHLSPTVTRSEAEERLLALVRAAGIPEPRVNAQLHGYEVDFWWPDAALVVEVDGYRFHSTRWAFERDRIRDARLQAAGTAVLRVTWRRLERERFAVLAEIATALAHRTPREIDAWSGPLR